MMNRVRRVKCHCVDAMLILIHARILILFSYSIPAVVQQQKKKLYIICTIRYTIISSNTIAYFSS